MRGDLKTLRQSLGLWGKPYDKNIDRKRKKSLENRKEYLEVWRMRARKPIDWE